MSGIIAAGLIPAALKIMDQARVKAVEKFVQSGYPTDAGAVLLAEVTGTAKSVAAGVEIIRSVAQHHAPTEIRVATDASERAILWKGRKAAFGAVDQGLAVVDERFAEIVDFCLQCHDLRVVPSLASSKTPHPSLPRRRERVKNQTPAKCTCFILSAGVQGCQSTQ